MLSRICVANENFTHSALNTFWISAVRHLLLSRSSVIARGNIEQKILR